MRIALRSIVVAVVAAAFLVQASMASARSSAQYRLEGRGWGHGLGMSQYGAQGYAEHGMAYDAIIRHYYTGTVVAKRPSDGINDIRVLLQSYLAPARIELESAGLVSQGGVSKPLLAGDVVEMRAAGGFIVTTIVRGTTRTIVTAASSADPVIVPEVDGAMQALFADDNDVTGRHYRGTISAHIYNGKISIVNTVPFEQYLRGVVPYESPSSWNIEALKAQAVAARSYALTSGSSSLGFFDVYCDTRSQVYGGLDREAASTDLAVSATNGLVARVGSATGDVARTYFFSTSGGRTASNEQVWGGSPISYLRSVASPYEAWSSHYIWTGSRLHIYTPAKLGEALGYAPGVFRSASSTSYGSGYAKEARVVTTNGVETFDGDHFRGKLGLDSSWFRVAYLSAVGPDSVTPGAYAKLTGRAPLAGTTSVILRSGGMSRTIKLKPTGPLGTWVVRVRVHTDLTAILTRANVTGPRITVRAAAPAPVTET